jgi:hypothetical protein
LPSLTHRRQRQQAHIEALAADVERELIAREFVACGVVTDRGHGGEARQRPEVEVDVERRAILDQDLLTVDGESDPAHLLADHRLEAADAAHGIAFRTDQLE